MRAIVIREPSGPDALILEESVPEPVPQSGEVVIQVKSVGVNFGLDTLVARGAFGSLRASKWEEGSEISFPLTPGADIAGVVFDASQAGGRFLVGDRVISHFVFACGSCRYCRRGQDNACVGSGYFGVHRNGGAADLVAVPACNLRPISDRLGFTEAAAIPVSFAVAWNMLVNLAKVRPGDWVLVMAAGSGIGVAALQIAKLHGARVIAAVGSAWKGARAAELGADVVVDYGAGPIAELVREATAGNGADVVIHGGFNQDSWDDVKSSVANLGRIVVCGAIGSGKVEVDVRHYYRHHFQLLGALAAPLSAFHEVCDQFDEGRLRPIVHKEVPLAQIKDAHRILNDRAAFGKVVLRVE